ncbi:hypothetical protein ACFQ3R_00465 [Mesonia ostreae]|uniref:Uncharacterized protein n=1 Tax=Mesonia ostreae TaxID=861110 RepID=A0ABU2KJE0_9FLAO|nr:hypothetical protein [Mesonia ostreae]MDT0294835.1 hypothetical protein [Mesonia ostreae]
MAQSFYPNIGTLVSLDDFPEELQFLETGLQNALDKIYYKELQYVQSNDGAQGYYNLVLVTGEQLKLDLFNTGFSIAINPGNAGETLIPLTLNYNWPVLALISSFNLGGFSYLPADLQNILNQTLSLGDTDLLQTAVQVFEGSNELSNYEGFVDKVNQHYSLSGSNEIPYPQDDTSLNMAEEIRGAIEGSTVISDSIQEVVNQVYIIDADNTTYQNNLNQFAQNLTGESIQDYIKRIIIPKIEASLSLAIGFAFPRNILLPVDASGNPIPDPEQSILVFDAGDLEFSTQGGINFREEMAVSLNHPSQIGNTGLGIDIVNAKLDLSKNSNIIEADLDGRSQDFIGIYTQYVAVTLPKNWFNNIDNSTLQLAGYNMLIGTGGVSGTIALETVGGQPNNGAAYMDMKIGNWEVGFNHFALTFKQNSVVESNIAGRLKIPKLKDAQGNDALVYLNGHINEEGDFNLTASEPEGIPFTLFNFVTFNFLTLELGRENDDFYIGTSCQIWFENPVMAKLIDNQIIEIPKLRVYDNGTVEIVGGNGFIPLSISLNLGPIEMAVTGVHYGSTQLEYNGDMRKYNYWGFDGGISLDPLGIDVRGDGIKYYYTTDNDDFGDDGDSFIHIKSLEIDLVIPGTASPESAIAIIHGMLSLPEPGESPEYVGEISLKLPKAKIAGGAAMKLQPKHPAFIIDAFLDLPAPIPIGPLGIYGFRGLLGYTYVAEKEAVGLVSGEDTWYDYYTYPPRGIHVSKFSGPPESLDYTAPVALGAGAVLGTSFDGGTTISARVMLVLSLPTLFMIDGRASILSARLGLDSTNEPPFFAFIAWGDNSIEMGMGADFKVPSNNGWILDLYAEVQSGFFFDAPSAWYVNFGTKQDPISARVLTIVTAQTYLMLSAQGIEAGARAEFDLRKRFGPAKVHLYAYLEVGGFISFERPQIGGYIAAGGGIDIDIWIIGISLELNALFSAEAAKPFLIYAEVRIRACVKIIFAKVCKSFTIKLKWEKSNTVDRLPVSPLPNSRRSELVKGVHMLTNEAFELNVFTSAPSASQINKVIPLDTYIEFKTQKGLVPGAVSGKIGGYTFAPENTVDLIPPQKTVRGGREVRQVRHRYSIEDIEIKAWNGSSWKDYHPFEAVVDSDNRPNVADLRLGYWQIKEKQYDTIRLMATTPFTYMEAGEPGWHIPEQYGLGPSTLYCQETLKKEHCSNVLNKNVGQKYYPPTQYNGSFINGAYYTLTGYTGYEIINGNAVPVNNEYMEVTIEGNVHGFAKSLSFNNDNGLIIYLPEASVKVKLLLTTLGHGVTIKYYRSIINDSISLVQYELVHQEYKTTSQLNSVVEYLNEDKPITKVIIQPENPNALTIQAIEEQINQLFAVTYEETSGIVNITEPNDRERYYELLDELNKLKTSGCTEQNGDCQKDEKLCELYNQLLALFESCFIYPVSEKEIELLLRQQDCFNQFHSILLSFDKANPDYHLIESMRELYIRFKEQLNKLNELMNRYPEEISASALISFYYEFRVTTINILEFIKERGECDCNDSPQLRCNTSLQQICWLSFEDHQWNETVPGMEAIQEDFESMIDALQKEAQPIWRPNTPYYIKYTLKDEVDNGDSSPGNYNFYYGFKTVGPVGHYHKNPASGYLPSGAKPEEYPLTSLRSYIDYNRSYPNANGNLLKSKPLFYGNEQCRISLYFNKPLTEHMFQKWYAYLNMPELEGQMHIAIKDPVTDVVVPYPLPVDYDENTVPIPDQAGYLWEADTDPILPPHIEAINNMIENAELPCEIDLGNPIKPNSTYFTVTLTNLKPQKLYTALFYNAFEKTTDNIVSEPVHEYVFQTSRYLNFAEQVNSYVIEDEKTGSQKQAVFNIRVELTSAAIQKTYGIIANPGGQTNDYPLANQYQDLFDRIIEGVWEMRPLDPPVRTEFLKIINKSTGEVVALLVRNPEPFNNPKIPLNEVEGMIAILFDTGSVNNAYKVLYSNDYSQAIIMHSNLEITASLLNFRFRYMNWNGNAYVVEDTVQVENIIIND